MADPATSDLLSLTAQIVAAHVAGNKVHADEVPDLIKDVYGALARVDAPAAVAQSRELALLIKRSIQHDYLVCLEDGAKMMTLKRHLRHFGLTPDTYRAKWGLPRDYPMTAPAYSAKRSALAKQSGLRAALRTSEQSAPEAPQLPVEAVEPTVPVPDAEHTAASVFANFPSADGPKKAAPAAEKPGRKRFAQQAARVGRSQ